MPDSWPCCFRSPGQAASAPAIPNTVSSIYETPSGLVVLTWSSTLLGHSLRADLHLHDGLLSYSLRLKPWLFWRKRGYKAFLLGHQTTRFVLLSWDLTRAKFLAGPDPVSGFHISIALNSETILLLGDSQDLACGARKAQKQSQRKLLQSRPALILRQEHVIGLNNFTTKARFGGKTRDISIDCTHRDDPRLIFRVDGERVLQVKKLKWKFRGSEKVEVDGVRIQVSWDVHSWLFDGSSTSNSDDSRHAIFMFRFEKQGPGNGEYDVGSFYENWDTKGAVVLHRTPTSVGKMETKNMSRRKGRLLQTSSSSSSSSVSSASSRSSVLDWASAEETELQSLPGFTLQVYARRTN